ncbi:FliI/YscN family ATPase [Parerythrobacter jejuensis]|uniref:FliI/YscN family ATPase n=1 Tax=Parerythrobacter jejuensis TaxID=795812 RepID=A0A845ANY7_9SPHN|nr:FliI/YscN family ATPase [Parerythrobacter jejuensis]MXP30571.1 FliI/YscN family ATPase [Parerythrobacter jejuensis]MXP33331.1 FliI/YscN family ATPase [Parerythrobacter jejuensis]
MNTPAALIETLRASDFAEFTGEVTAIGQGGISASGPLCAVGEMCRIGDGGDAPLAEVVAVDAASIQLLPLGPVKNILPGARVRRSGAHSTFRSGDAFAGRAVDGFGAPIDGGAPLLAKPHHRALGIDALSKTVHPERVATGLRAIDALLPIAQGQRIGIFAASGVGKTTLVEQLSSQIDCDHVVACLIGERGREVERLWDMHRKGSHKDKITLVAATSDESASARVRAMHQALALCEEWRTQGKHVVLFVDSVTRLAMALREIGLAAGEPPSVRSYTPNVFAALPNVVERCGAIRGGGAITAIFTVLSETDDVDDPIVETMKSILDGHIVLSRKLAEKGHYPAIDIAASVSRVADQLLDQRTQGAAQALRRSFAEFEESRAMIESGIYQAGSSTAIDRAIALQPRIAEFVRQTQPESADLAAVDAKLAQCVAEGGVL